MAATDISTVDHMLPHYTHNTYDVTLSTHWSSPPPPSSSIFEQIHPGRLRSLVVGLDVEWRPKFNGNIFQLADFLKNADYTFVGVGIDSDVEKLIDDYGLSVARAVDVRKLAADELGNPDLRLKTLARVVLDKEFDKPRRAGCADLCRTFIEQGCIGLKGLPCVLLDFYQNNGKYI